MDFSILRMNIDKNKMHVQMETSAAGHLLPPDQSPNPKVGNNKTPYEVEPDGNSVVLEEQMTKASDTQINYALMVNLYRDTADMIRTSLGKKS